MHDGDRGKYLSINLDVAPTTTIAEIGSHCHLVIALLRSSKESVNSPIAIFRQLAAGNWTSLIGLPESSWFEAKRKLHGLSDAKQRFELALDVSAIANLREGGVLIVGVSTKRDEYDIDRVDGAAGVARLRLSIPRIEQILDNLIFPTVDGMIVSVFSNQDREILALLIPPQNREKYPFLVKGFVHEESDFWATGFTWAEKRAGSKQVMQISEIHRLISRSLTT